VTLFISAVLIIATLALLIPVAVFALECIMAARHPDAASHKPVAARKRPTVAVVVPAHDEEAVIGKTLAALAPQLTARDRVIVVADNCSDRTAEVALQHGARVLRRNDAKRRGKGYALDHAVQFLRKSPPDAVVFIDADCRLSAGAVKLLGRLACAHQRPVQACNQMKEPAGALERSVAGFAWLVRGTVRPTGLAAMGMPCQLYGTGMAFPWRVLHSLSLASSNIVEDMKLTVDLIGRRTLPLFCRDAAVISAFAPAPDSAGAQRRRWEHGHLATLFKYGIPALARALWKRDAAGIMLALDICVPPLSLLVMLLFILSCASTAAIPFVDVALYTTGACAVAWLALFIGLGLAWRRFARGEFSLKTLTRIPVYAASKVPLYFRFLTGREKEWNRTARK
jgi:cellulose synthase/poly-beta-1,6-N-acetylglucosamine synthase-like glycosyltransferase